MFKLISNGLLERRCTPPLLERRCGEGNGKGWGLSGYHSGNGRSDGNAPAVDVDELLPDPLLARRDTLPHRRVGAPRDENGK